MWQLKKWVFRKVQGDDEEEMASKSPPSSADLDDSDSDFVPPVDPANGSSDESSKADDNADDVAGNVHKKQKNKGQKQIKKIAKVTKSAGKQEAKQDSKQATPADAQSHQLLKLPAPWHTTTVSTRTGITAQRAITKWSASR